MKRVICLTLTLALLLIINTVQAQFSATATTTAEGTIITKLTATGTPLQFGDMVAGSAASTVHVSSANARTVTGGDVTLVNNAAHAPSAAIFNISGEPNYRFSISLPGNFDIVSGVNKMNVSLDGLITSEFFLDDKGEYTFPIGGTLSVGAGQPTGTYSGTFSVTFQYP